MLYTLVFTERRLVYKPHLCISDLLTETGQDFWLVPSRSSTCGLVTRVPPTQSGHSLSFQIPFLYAADCLQWVPCSLPLTYDLPPLTPLCPCWHSALRATLMQPPHERRSWAHQRKGSKLKGGQGAEPSSLPLGQEVVDGGWPESGGLCVPVVPIITVTVVPHPSKGRGVRRTFSEGLLLSAFTPKQLPRSFEILNPCKGCKSYGCQCY